jgi:hypothetical protein
MRRKINQKKTTKINYEMLFKKILLYTFLISFGFTIAQIRSCSEKGAILVKTKSDQIAKDGIVEVFNSKNKLLRTANFDKNQTLFSLSAGKYFLKVKYGNNLLLDDSCTVKIQSKIIYLVQFSTPTPATVPAYITVDVSTDKKVYEKGSNFNLNIHSDTEGYFWVFAIDPKNQFSQLFPILNVDYSFDNRISPNEVRIVPNDEQDKDIRFKVADEPGKEKIVVIITQTADREQAVNIFAQLHPEMKIEEAGSVVIKQLYGWASLTYEVEDQIISIPD